jgi:Sodium/hydrogen exchanger family
VWNVDLDKPLEFGRYATARVTFVEGSAGGAGNRLHNPKVGRSNPPPATMNDTAEMQWRSPPEHWVLRTRRRPGLASFSSQYSEERYSVPSWATPRADSRERLMTPKCRSLSPPLLPTAVIYLPTSCICRGSLRPHRAGLIVGNLGTKSCSAQTKTALESFWAYVAFMMNSLVFLLIGIEIHVDVLLRSWRPVLLTVVAVLVGRALSVYLLAPVSNTLTEKIPLRWHT